MEQKTLSAVSDAVVQEPVVLEVDIAPRNRFHAWLQGRRIMPKKRKLIIHPIYFGTLIRISKLLQEIDLSGFDVASMLDSNYSLIRTHGRTIATIIATAVHNRRSQTPESLISFVMDNFTSKELLSTLIIILRQMNIGDFMNSIISIRGMNVLDKKTANAQSAESDEMSPADQGR